MKLSALTLLAAISEGKKRILMDRYGATEEQLTIVDAADPTASGTYAEWITRSWLNQHLINLPEDTRIVRADLSKFNRVKNKAEWGQNSKDIMTYNPERLRAALTSIQEVDDSVPEVSAEVLYSDGTYTLWKVTTVADAMALSAKSGWCTKSDNMASHYLAQAPLYTAFKNGEPLFQYHSGGKSGSPQFMNRFNSTMQSAKIMNEEAYNLIAKVPNPDPDLQTVLEKFKAPDLSEAETFSYLKDVLATNPEYAKNNKEFQELEKKFIEQRYKIFDEEELAALLDKYDRTGDVVSKFLDENPRVRVIIKKIEDTGDFSNLAKEIADNKFTNHELHLMFKIPGLFSKVFALFSKSNDFDNEVAKLKTLIKENKDTEAYDLANQLVAKINSAFKERSYYSYRDDGSGPAIKNSEARAAARKYVDIIINMVRPLMAATLTNIANQNLPLEELGKSLTEAIEKINRASNNDTKVAEWCNRRRKEILIPAAKKEMEQGDGTIEGAIKNLGLFEKYLSPSMPWREFSELKEDVIRTAVLPKIKEKFDDLVNNSGGKDFPTLASEYNSLYTSVMRQLHDNTVASAMQAYGKDMLSAGLTETLAQVPKLKAVTEKLEELGLEDYNWAERLAETRKAEIRAERDEKAQARQQAIETGDASVKVRYSPKRELETYYTNLRQWNRNHEIEGAEPGEKPKLSDKGEKFLLTSPAIPLHDIVNYFAFQGKKSPELEAKLIASNDFANALTYETKVLKNEPWPELEEALLRVRGWNDGYVDQYKQKVYPTSEWPARTEAAIKYFNESNFGANRYLIENMNEYNEKNRGKKKWDLLEKKALEFLKSRDYSTNKQAWWLEDKFFGALLHYVRDTKTRLDKELEKKACEEDTDFATKYLFTLIPKDKISEIIERYSSSEPTEEEAGAKTSSHHISLFAVLMNELEKMI